MDQRSWIGVGAFSIQPSEFMKLAMIAFLAKFLSEKQKKYHILSQRFCPSFRHCIFCICHHHASTGSGNRNGDGWNLYYYDICFRCENCSLYISRPYRAQWVCCTCLISTLPNKTNNILFKSLGDPLGSGFQIIQSLYAVGPGGLFGMGLG